MEVEGRVQGGHGEQQRQLLQRSRRCVIRGEAAAALGPPVHTPVPTRRRMVLSVPERREGVIVAFVEQRRVYMAQYPKEYSSAFPAVRPEEGQADEELGHDHRVDHIRQDSQIVRTVRPKLEVPQNVVIFPGQILQVGPQKAELQGLAHM